MSPPTTQQLNTFHAQDRQLFSKLVIKFSRSVAESLLVMATWFWFEDFFLQDISSTILACSDSVIIALANEAVFCYQFLESHDQLNHLNQIPLTTNLMKNNISLQTLYKNRYTAIIGIKNFLNTVCSRIFSDIIQQVLPSSYPLEIPGFPHPTFGNINVIMPDVIVGHDLSDNNNLLSSPHGLWGWNANCTQTNEDKTMFITFSRGYPVSLEEVEIFFTINYGEHCVESIYMEEDNNTNKNRFGQEQSLFAKMVVDSVATVDRILDGQKVQKFISNGKHIWVRKYNMNKDG